MTIWRMRIACWMPKAKNTQTHNNVILIAFPLQQWLHERASTLRFTYIACLVVSALCFHEFVKQECEKKSLELQSHVGLV